MSDWEAQSGPARMNANSISAPRDVERDEFWQSVEVYPEGWEGDYLMLRDAVLQFLGEFLIEDDVAEPAIMSDGVRAAAQEIRRLRSLPEGGRETCCIACGENVTSQYIPVCDLCIPAVDCGHRAARLVPAEPSTTKGGGK